MSALSLAEAKTHLNMTGDAQDEELESTIAAAEAAIVALIGPLEPVSATDYISTHGLDSFGLRLLPVLSLTSITPAGGTAMNLTDVRVEHDSGLVSFIGGRGSWTASEYTVVYQAGRDPVPADLLMAVRELVRHFWSTQRGPTRRPGASPSDALANTIPGAAYALPIRVSQLLAPYQTFGFA